MFGVPVFAFTPVDGGKVDELVEDVFLILVDIKNVMLIGTGQITEGLNHVTQEFMAFDTLLAKVCFLHLLSRTLNFKQWNFAM